MIFGSILSRLKKENSIAPKGFNRWFIPPCALAVHLCIGMAYGFSVFWLPLSTPLNNISNNQCLKESFFDSLFSSTCEWKISMLGWTYTLFFIFLGSAAALFGKWLESEGPRKAGVISAFCWCGGLVISAYGIYIHQLWLLWLGSGVIGGIGLGIGYISPVSTLIKWFPDRRGLATGMAIMGFGGGAVIGAPLTNFLMKYYSTTTSNGVWQTFLTLAGIYFIFMISGALNYYLPNPHLSLKGRSSNKKNLTTLKHVHINNAWKTPQFWLIWGVLCLNVTAGIGIIGIASPMLQEIFAGKLIGVSVSFNELNAKEKAEIAAIAAGFTGLLSLFNICGRIIWSSFSDVIGRKYTYYIFFVAGSILYTAAPSAASYGSVSLFVIIFCFILSMYGGGFATIPAYLADIFGTQMVGAIHGRILTAWSAAGIFGPVIVNYLREYQLSQGASNVEAYSITIYLLAILLTLGLVFNFFIKDVDPKYHMADLELGEYEVKKESVNATSNSNLNTDIQIIEENTTITIRSTSVLIFAWSAVGLPLCWGIWITIQKTLILF